MILSIYDLLLAPFYLLLIYSISKYIERKNIGRSPIYRWYTIGLFVKISGAILLCMMYQFYYSGGDTTSYFLSAKAFSNMLSKDASVFFDILLFGDNSWDNYSYFDANTGWPSYWKETKTVFVSRLIVPFCILSFKNFVITSILLAWACYSGIWKLFQLYCEYFPKINKQMAISFLFIPSVIFWGSGILKDTITLSAIGWYIYNFYYFFIKKKYSFLKLFNIIVSSAILILIKPYIFFALIPGTVIWLSNEQLEKVSNKLIKFIIAPMFIVMGIGLGIFILTQMGDLLGEYSLDTVLDKAVISNLDQKQDYYGGNSFDIGDFDATYSGALSKAHLAIMATFYRPFLWEAKNYVMVLSGLENMFMLLFTILLLIRLRVYRFFLLINNSPLLLFSMLFALFFAFSVGLATSNFGSLVRLKIPCIPFFVSSLFALKFFYEEKTKKKLL